MAKETKTYEKASLQFPCIFYSYFSDKLPNQLVAGVLWEFTFCIKQI